MNMGRHPNPVKSEEAKCSDDADAELINGYIRKLKGGHSELDKKLTERILESNQARGPRNIRNKPQF